MKMITKKKMRKESKDVTTREVKKKKALKRRNEYKKATR